MRALASRWHRIVKCNSCKQEEQNLTIITDDEEEMIIMGENDNSVVQCVIIMICSSVLIATIFSNGLILGLFFDEKRGKKLRSRSNYFIASLAMADLGVAIFVMPLSLITFSNDGIWQLGSNWCRFWIFFDFLFCSSSVICLLFVALDRFLAVKDPVWYAAHRTDRQAVEMLIVGWFVGLLLTFPTLIAILSEILNIDYDKCLISFGSNESNTRILACLTAFSCFFAPIFALIITYVRIFYKIGDYETGKIKSDHMHLIKRQKKLLRVLFAVISGFILCWSPFWSVYLASVMCEEENRTGYCGYFHSEDSNEIHFLLQWLGYANSLINPFLYAFVNRDFRDEMTKFAADCKACCCMIIDIK